MSESEKAPRAPVVGERETGEGQEVEVPSRATMHSQPPVPVTVPPEPYLEHRPPVVGAADTPKQVPAQSVPTPHSSAVRPSSQFAPQSNPHVRQAVPSHIHGGSGVSKPSPLSQQPQFGRPAPRLHPGIQGFPPGAQKNLSPEQMEEAKLRSKYGKLNKPGGSDFLRMRLNKGGQKYFDSGDYNMAKSKGKPGLRQPVIATKPGLPVAVEATTGDTIPTPASIHHRKQSVEISKLAV